MIALQSTYSASEVVDKCVETSHETRKFWQGDGGVNVGAEVETPRRVGIWVGNKGVFSMICAGTAGFSSVADTEIGEGDRDDNYSGEAGGDSSDEDDVGVVGDTG